jgi:glycosyltransferase involved in cell wall biosynthesis
MLPGLIRGDGFDVTHAHGYLDLSSNMAALVSRVRRSPLVLTSHGAVLDYRGWKGSVEALYHRTLGKWTLKTADRIIALTSTQADILVSLGADRSRVAVIPLWMDLSQFRPPGDEGGFRRAYNLVNRRVVLFVGGLQPRKGLRYLVEAAKHITDRATIVIVGDEQPTYAGSKQALQEQVKALGLEERVLFAGNIPRDQLGGVYSAADVFVLPSLAEGLPTVLLEAMAHGTCVIGSDIPGNRDVVRDGVNGALVEARNAEALAKKIDALLADDALRARLGAQGRRDIEENYSPATVLSRILKVYQEVRGG